MDEYSQLPDDEIGAEELMRQARQQEEKEQERKRLAKADRHMAFAGCFYEPER